MRNDEFNKVEITNEQQVRGLEFGKTQKSETTFQPENKLPEGELNEKYVGKTIRKQTEVNVQYANKATAPAHGSTTVTSATTASNIAATTTTVVTAASVVAVTAISVATGISVALHDYEYKFEYFEVTSNSLNYELYIVDHKNERADGQPYEEFEEEPTQEDVPHTSDIDEEINEDWVERIAEELDVEAEWVRDILDKHSFDTYEEALEFVKEEIAKEEEEKPFTLHVYNSAYDFSIPTALYTNVGEFTNLKPNEEYHIVLSENRFGGETLFDKTFTTKETDPVSEFRGITWDKKCNFLTNKTTIKLDYQDDRDIFSDFKLILKSEMVTATGPLTLTYNLEKTTEEQEIQLDQYPEFNLALMYSYSITYMCDGEEIIAEEGQFQFEDNSGAKSEFNRFIFDKTANFKNRTFEVQLDYVDDFNIYSDFVLTFIYIIDEPVSGDGTEEDEFTVDIPLRKTTETQIIDLDGIEISLSETYKYRLTCMEYDEKKILDQGTVTFIDNSGAIIRFNKFIFDESINYDTREITLQLDYTDELGYLYGFEFILTDLETNEERSYYLMETTEPQTIEVNEIKEYDDDNNPIYYIDPVRHQVKYSFRYMRLDEQIDVIKDKECRFKNSLVSTFLGLDTPYDFAHEDAYETYILPIRFLFDDAAREYSEFEVSFYKNDELYGRLAFEGETHHSRWMNGVFTEMEGHTIDEIINTQIKISVSTYVVSIDDPGGVETEIYTETATFTLDEKKALYGLDFMDSPEEPASIAYGNYEIMFIPIFSGNPYYFETYLKIECQTGNTYMVPFYMGTKNQIVYANLQYCNNFFEENFEADFSSTVKLSVVYYTYHMEMVPGDSTTDPHEERVEDTDGEKTFLISESYQFMLQA